MVLFMLWCIYFRYDDDAQFAPNIMQIFPKSTKMLFSAPLHKLEQKKCLKGVGTEMYQCLVGYCPCDLYTYSK